VPLLLHHTGNLPRDTAYDFWFGVAGAKPDLPTETQLSDLSGDLETAFEDAAVEWLALAREMSQERSGHCSHVTSCATNVSDFGEMLAWGRVCAKHAESDAKILAVCDDPWLFRHLSMTVALRAGSMPGFGLRHLRLALRGFAARTSYAVRALADCYLLRSHRRNRGRGGAWILVYGHPRSDATGVDGYFGDLPKQLDHLSRALHVDCPRQRANELRRDGRTVSLRGWGRSLSAMTLPFCRWRPSANLIGGSYGWLVRRAAALEGGTAQAAAIEWQLLCQRSWLKSTAPRVVAWPFENHTWERSFTRDARAGGTSTLGYQHSVVGRHMLNYAPASMHDGIAGFPDTVFCTGPSTRDQLLAWDIPDDKVTVGGALRFADPACPRHDPAAPVFVALPFDHVIADEMMAAVRTSAEPDREFLVRDHPMTPYPIQSQGPVRRADGPLDSLPAVSSVIYAATTVGLEALIAGLPTLRFRSRSKLSVDILPPGIVAPTTEATTLARDLGTARPPSRIDRAYVFAAPDMALWHSQLKAT
jgi:hypothetical protein